MIIHVHTYPTSMIQCFLVCVNMNDHNINSQPRNTESSELIIYSTTLV